MTNGPLLVGDSYTMEREIAYISESRRTESYWVRSTIKEPSTGKVKAEALLNRATLKDS
jgi:hypothetical protein